MKKCLKDFKAVKEACFGKNLENGFDRSFEQLKNSFTRVQEMAEGLYKNYAKTVRF